MGSEGGFQAKRNAEQEQMDSRAHLWPCAVQPTSTRHSCEGEGNNNICGYGEAEGPSCICESVQFSHAVMSDSLRPHGLQHSRLPCPSPTPGACSDSTDGVSDAIQPSCPLLSSSPAFSLAQHQGLFQRVSSSHQVAKVGVSASASILPMIFRTDFT